MTAPWLERTELLLGEEKLERLSNANVLVVGLGGVGAYAAEMIARAGVGRMTIADADIVSESNINRQLVALHSTVGRSKSEILAQRLRDINPEIELTVVQKYIRDDATWELLDSEKFDFVIDAIDTLSPKAALIKGALDRKIPLVSSMGAGAKTDPTKVEIRDISQSHHCPLAHMLRKRLHKWDVRTGFWAVFSPEPIRDGAMIIAEETNKKSNVGTISYMPAVFGCACASVVIRSLIGELNDPKTEQKTNPKIDPKSNSGKKPVVNPAREPQIAPK
jgi:tRNA A37 threonylcarbamoyladenosine dehydratase